MEDITLNEFEVRVLGALVEKAHLTPDVYPLSLNGLVAACNQTTSRDPVVHYGEATVLEAVHGLQGKKLVEAVQQPGSRVEKYRHRLAEQLLLQPREAALMCLLLLRGPQTPGEIKSRSGRLYEFADLAEVEATLTRLQEERYPPRVARLPRQSGTKEARYAHTLGEGLPSAREPATGAVPAPASDRVQALEVEVAALRAEVAELRRLIQGE